MSGSRNRILTEESPAARLGSELSLDTFNRATHLASHQFENAVASIVFVYYGEIWQHSEAANGRPKTLITQSVAQTGELLWIESTREDERTAKHPMVIGAPFSRFAVFVPIRLHQGDIPGVLCVYGPDEHPLDATKAACLQDIADFVANEWERSRIVADLDRLLRERDEALHKRMRSEERLNAALGLADIHVWEMDYKERKLFKAGAEDTLFHEPQTYQGLYKDLYVTVDPRDRQMVREAWNDHIENGAVYRPEYRINRPDGAEVWAQASVKFICDEQGKPARAVGAMQNITNRKRSEHALIIAMQEAEAANKAKSAFLATMSHELRTPLNAILGFAEMIKEQIVGPVHPRYVDYAQDIYASGRHLLDLVNDVLDISKLEAGKVDLHESEFDARKLLRETVTSFSALAKDETIEIGCDFESFPWLRADKRLIKQILLNLLSNALKFTPAGGSISVTAHHDPERKHFAISVTDTGIGMSSAEIEIALSPFGQIDSNIARRHKGTGLGLPISRSLMRLHGGDLLVESETGFGTRVIMLLPEARVVTEGKALHQANA